MIEVRDLVKNYGAVTAVKGVSFKLEDGRVYGLLGPNGAGKSTTMNIMTGCLAATSGEVYIDGHEIFSDPIEAKKRIGYLPEQPPVYGEMTPDEYLEFVGEAKGLKGEDLRRAIGEVEEMTGIAEVKKRLIRNLSKGYRQRVGIAQAIIGSPDTVILDEPTVGLDPRQIIEIRDLIRELGKKHTVILSSHILSEVSAVCDYILVINDGRLVAEDTPEKLSEHIRGENTVEIKTKASREKVTELLGSIGGVSEAVFRDAGEKGLTAFSVTPENGADLREKIFFAFAKANCPIYEMTRSGFSLEDIFLRLTDEGAPSPEAAEEAKEEAYEPLFSGGEEKNDKDNGKDKEERY